MPVPPSPKERSTGLTMGQHCEVTAQLLGLSREDQDRLAYISHMNATRAMEAGHLAEEIAAYKGVDRDDIIRADDALQSIYLPKNGKERPFFERTDQGHTDLPRMREGGYSRMRGRGSA